MSAMPALLGTAKAHVLSAGTEGADSAITSAKSSTHMSVLSRMNEQLASENASLIAELAKLQRRSHRQTSSSQLSLLPQASVQLPEQMQTVAGIPVNDLASLLAPPGAMPSSAGMRLFFLP